MRWTNKNALRQKRLEVEEAKKREKAQREEQRIQLRAGLKMGLWTLLEPGLTEGGEKAWICRCECGLVKPVRASELRGGASLGCQSCRRGDRKERESRGE
jgi:hypothetical protein